METTTILTPLVPAQVVCLWGVGGVQGRGTRDLWHHICFSQGVAILEIVLICVGFFLQ